MYDFYEFLGSGIIAARTGRTDQVARYLRLAAKIEPDNPRTRLWLAATAETLSEKRRCLESVGGSLHFVESVR